MKDKMLTSFLIKITSATNLCGQCRLILKCSIDTDPIDSLEPINAFNVFWFLRNTLSSSLEISHIKFNRRYYFLTYVKSLSFLY